MEFCDKVFINGAWVSTVKGNTFQNFRPTTGELLCDVAAGSAEDIDLAVQAAKVCLNGPTWGYASTGAQRAVVLRRLGELITANKEKLARLDSLDQGKPFREAMADMGDAEAACSHFAMLAEKQDKDQDEIIDCGMPDFVTKIRLEPIGVIGAITPWNYPFLMGIWKVCPAIAAGCTVVLKPSELAPLSCLLLAQLCKEAGLPDGALNVVTGLGPDCGGPLTTHPGIDKISFTGSVATGSRVMSAAAAGPKGVCLELGGKSPLIVFEDADINSCVDWIITGFVWGSGQVCSSTSRVLVHESIIDAVLTRLTERLSTVRIGDTQSEEFVSFEGAQMGPVVSKGQYDKIWSIINGAKSSGLNIVYGGDQTSVSSLGGGYYIPPTVILNPPVDNTVWKDEIFGPVLCLRSFSNEEEAVYVANDSEFGLAAAVFTANEERCEQVSRKMRAGIVWKNCCQPAFIQAPWGGVKKSGVGRELGRWGLEEFTSVKQITSCNSGYSWSLW